MPVTKAIRILASVSLVAIAAGIATTWWLVSYSLASMPYPAQEFALPTLVVQVVGQSGFSLATVAGVVAIVDSLQHKRIGWPAVLIFLLVASFFSVDILVQVMPFVGLGFALRLLLLEFAPDVAPLTLALVALIYTFTNRRPVIAPS